MKNFKTLLLATALFIGATSVATAQGKMAHVDRQDIVKSLPAYKSAQGEIEKLSKTYEAEMKSNIEELDKRLKQYNAEAEGKSEEENLKRMEEVEGMKQAIAQYRQQAQQGLQKKEVDLLKPLVEKVDAAINKVAASKGFDYVMDKGVFIRANGTDLTNAVKSELGVQ